MRHPAEPAAFSCRFAANQHVINTDLRAQEWIESYRDLLDRWQLWTERAKFDVGRRRAETGVSQAKRTCCCVRLCSPCLARAVTNVLGVDIVVLASFPFAGHPKPDLLSVHLL